MKAVVLVLALCACAIAQDLPFDENTSDLGLDYNRVRLVAYNKDTGNFLFRTDLPGLNGTGSFAYPQLMSYFEKRAIEAKITWPTNSYMYDISVMGDIEKYEVDFWADPKNKDKGELQHLTLIGIKKFPWNYTAAEQKEQAVGPIWAKDLLPTRVPKIIDVYNTKHTRPYAMFVHCRYGCDRTGEMITALRTYGLGFNNMRTAYAQTCTDARCPMPEETSATMWWCLYLQFAKSRDMGNCTNYAKCDKSTCKLV